MAARLSLLSLLHLQLNGNALVMARKCYDFSSLYLFMRLSRTVLSDTPVRTPRFVSHITFLPLSRFASSSLADVAPLHSYLGL